MATADYLIALLMAGGVIAPYVLNYKRDARLVRNGYDERVVLVSRAELAERDCGS